MTQSRPAGAMFMAAGAVLGALAVGLAVGVATSYLQGWLPTSLNILANSGAVWSVVAFGVVAALNRPLGSSVAAGLAGLGSRSRIREIKAG